MKLSDRAGYQTSRFMARDVGELARKHGLTGCVLISFTGDYVGVNSSGVGSFAGHMATLGDRLLAAIDDGKFDPVSEAAKREAARDMKADMYGENGNG